MVAVMPDTPERHWTSFVEDIGRDVIAIRRHGLGEADRKADRGSAAETLESNELFTPA
jgi:hypothetical protein